MGAACALFGFAALVDAGYLHDPLRRYLEARTQRQIRADGPVRTHLLSLHPRIEAQDVIIGNPPWIAPGHAAQVGRLAVSFDLPLISRGFAVRELSLQNAHFILVRDERGSTNWRRTPGRIAGRGAPLIRRLTLRNTRVELHDARRHIEFDGRFAVTGGNDGNFVKVDGRGTLNGRPVSLAMTGDPLDTARRSKPYRFTLAERSSGTLITAHGMLSRPYDFGGMNVDFHAAGADLKDLYYLVGLSLPDTGAYELSGKLARRDSEFRYSDLALTTGASDLRGSLLVDNSGERTRATAQLQSKLLRLADLGAKAANRAPAEPRGGALPTRPLRLNALRRNDATVSWRIDTLQWGNLRMRAAEATFRMRKGELTAEPHATLPGGRITGTLRFDAASDVPHLGATLIVSGLQLADFAKPGNDAPVEGLLRARMQIEARGNSLHALAASANGDVTAVLPHGAIRSSLAELIGTDLRSVGLLAGNSDATTPMRCAVAHFQLRDGTANAQSILLDTDPVIFTGSGTIDLTHETLDLKLQGRPKSPRLRLRGPLTLGGTLSDPAFGIDATRASLQGGAAVVLGALLTPIAAALAFVDPGLAKDADCAAVLASAGAGTN